MSKRIMVVDDSSFIWEELQYILGETEYEIVGYAKSGEEAIELYEKLQPDAVTLDIVLPGIDGIDTAKQIRSKWPDAKIIMISSLAYDDTMDEANAAGACDFIFKPFDIQQILDALEKVLS